MFAAERSRAIPPRMLRRLTAINAFGMPPFIVALFRAGRRDFAQPGLALERMWWGGRI